MESRIVLIVQSLYYLVTGLWPVIHIDSFMQVTGYKTEIWLVKALGVMIVCIALALFIAYRRKETSFGIRFLAVSCAIGLLLIDLRYNLSGDIGNMYLLDAAVQVLLLFGWLLVRLQRK